MSGHLLDTNITSELRKRKPHGGVISWLNQVDPNQVYVSAATIGEMQAGIEITRRQDAAKALELERWVDQLSEMFTVLPMDGDCFREWARLMNGKPDHLYEDAMIAATARLYDLTVVTRNVRDFEQFGVPVLNPFETRP